MGQKEMAMTGKNGIMIYGPKADGTYIVEFKTASGEALAISIPASETRVVRYFQERMPYGLFVPDVPWDGTSGREIAQNRRSQTAAVSMTRFC